MVQKNIRTPNEAEDFNLPVGGEWSAYLFTVADKRGAVFIGFYKKVPSSPARLYGFIFFPSHQRGRMVFHSCMVLSYFSHAKPAAVQFLRRVSLLFPYFKFVLKNSAILANGMTSI